MRTARSARSKLVLLVWLVPATAAASHSPAMPIAQRILARPNDASHIVIATRFGGLYVTADGGTTFFDVCHEALGSDDTEVYPGVFTADGTAAVSTGFRGVSTSQEGCEWSQWAPESLGLIRDMATFGSSGLLALQTETELPSKTEVWVSSDAGTTWLLSGDALPSYVEAEAITASSDGSQWFVGVTGAMGAALLRSKDGGRSWSMLAFPPGWRTVSRFVGMTPPPLERLVAILSGDQGDAVVLSDDAGQTWSTLFASPHTVPGAALDEEGVLFFGAPEEGLYRISLGDVGDTSPLLVSMTPTRGLAAAGGRVYSIGDEPSDGYSVAVSADRGATFTPFFSLCKTQITGTCAADSSVSTACAFGIETEPWQPLGPACAPKSAATAPAAEPVSTPGPTRAPASAPVDPPATTSTGCSIARDAHAGGTAPLGVTLATLFLAVRRRRR